MGPACAGPRAHIPEGAGPAGDQSTRSPHHRRTDDRKPAAICLLAADVGRPCLSACPLVSIRAAGQDAAARQGQI